LKPLIFLTNCSEAARTSSSVTGGSKLKSVLIFLHIGLDSPFLVDDRANPLQRQSFTGRWISFNQ
jgi:hypothetical protein